VHDAKPLPNPALPLLLLHSTRNATSCSPLPPPPPPPVRGEEGAVMDGGPEDEWKDQDFLDEVFRVTDEVVASRNPNPTPTAAPAPAPAHSPVAATPISYLPAYAPVSYLPATSAPASASLSYRPAASNPSPAPGFSPPRELTQRPPLPLLPAASGDSDALSTARCGFSPPRELSQHPAAGERDCAIVGVPGPAVGDRFMGTGGNVGAKREREAREVERLKVIPQCECVWTCSFTFAFLLY
jgi:hypothetical protein